MTKEEILLNALRGNLIEEPEAALLPGVVVSASETSCEVELTTYEVTITDVVYTSTLDNDSGFIIKPKEGTNCIVGIIGNDVNTAYLLSVDEIESVSLKANEVNLTISSDGKIHWGNESVSIKDLFESILEMVKKLTVSTAVGASGTPLPPTIQAISQIENDVKTLFK